jgi:hypothetical protein
MPFCRNQNRIWFGQTHVWANDDKEEKKCFIDNDLSQCPACRVPATFREG